MEAAQYTAALNRPTQIDSNGSQTWALKPGADPKNPRSLRDDGPDALRYLCGPFAAPEQDLRPSEIESRMGDEPETDMNRSGIESAW